MSFESHSSDSRDSHRDAPAESRPGPAGYVSRDPEGAAAQAGGRETAAGLDLDAIRTRLSELSGPVYWRTLEELSQTPTFQDYLDTEFHSQRGRFAGDGASRRDFLRLMGASLALAGVSSCTRQPEEKLVPYAAQPENRIPGRPQLYASALPLHGSGLGVLVESHGGRPTKVEGNPEHPSSLGSTERYAQASILSMYDPDRSRAVSHTGRPSTFDAFVSDLRLRLALAENRQGEGFAVLTEEVLSPTLARQLDALLARLPKAKVVSWQPVHRDEAKRGAMLAFGRDVATHPRYDLAEVVVSLDADFLGQGGACVRATRDFAERRRVRAHSHGMNRLWAVESSISITGTAAEDRLPVKPSEVEGVVRALARKLGVEVQTGALSSAQQAWVDAVAKDLEKNRGRSVVVVGDTANGICHALGHAINAKLDNVGKTVKYTRPVEEPLAGKDRPAMTEALRELVADMKAGKVQSLLMLGGNPVYSTASSLDFLGAMNAVEWRAHLSSYEDETSRHCHWHVPQAHAFEAWSTLRGADGTLAVGQPLIAPLFNGVSDLEILSALLDPAPRASHDLVREHVGELLGANAGANAWRTVVHDGVLPGTAFPALSVSLRSGLDFGPVPPTSGQGIEISVRPDASAHDGRYANNAWLQELPRPISLVVWNNPILIGPETAAAQKLSSGDLVELGVADRKVSGPVFVVPGQPEGTVTVTRGYGRTHGGHNANGVGFSVSPLLGADGSSSLSGATLKRSKGREAVVHVQEHGRLEGRDLFRETTFRAEGLEEQLHATHVHHHETPEEAELYGDRLDFEKNYQWGMVVDLGVCTGCNVCVLACVAENNIPIVGAEQVSIGREMHWIRIDRYYVGDLSNPKVRFQPVPCMHCERAPCEVVCPVNATTHSPEGLNEMVYNRCVGTRYCSNNCPYKVRRFNFFLYQDFKTESFKAGRNPDVSVRARGVMEKCTYCVQRINQARIRAKVEGRRIQDGEVVTACQQACPAQAITFGDISDPGSRVSKEKAEPHNYGLLGELGTRPRTTYLAKVTNPADGVRPS